MSFLYPPLCDICKHFTGVTFGEEHEEDGYIERTFHCKAYPDGVPAAVYEAGHRYAKPGDHGIQFEVKEGREDLPAARRKTRAEEDKDYRWYANYYEELNMTDEEFAAKMKREHGKDWHMYQKPSRNIIFD